MLRAAIEANGIPVEVVGLGGLLTVPEVADIVATLRVLHDPAASGSLARLLAGPRWRIGPRDLVALGRRARALAAEPPGQPPAPGGQRPPGPPGGRPAERGAEGTAVAHQDALTQVVTDLTADPGSLVEALDDLGDAGAYSAQAHQRFAALAAELRALRAHVSRSLPDLVGEVERVLGLDIEVAAQPWRDPTAARADLDAFADAAAAFADDEEEPTLGAFLAYLTAAEAEEFGLESGQPSGANAVTLTTVHAAKGLQWAAVVVPGLAAGARAQVFPAKPRVTTRWTENARLLPFSLRGDAADLPALPDLTQRSRDGFLSACLARELAEERRLAYVAVTRAAFWVACSGYWWGTPCPRWALRYSWRKCGPRARRALAPSRSGRPPPRRVRRTQRWPSPRPCHGRRGRRAPTTRPSGRRPGWSSVPWRVRRRARVRKRTVRKRTVRRLSEADRTLAQAWARDTDLLLAELSQRRGGAAAEVWLPGRLSVSSLVTMAADPARLAQQIRRPMPRPPAPQAQRGSAFHLWLEQRFGQQRLIDPTDLLGAADDDDGADDADLALLRERFEAGEWGDRWPVDVEVPFETLIGGRTVRGRIDAVFADLHRRGL